VLAQAVRRMTRHLRRRSPSAALEARETEEPVGDGDKAERRLAASAVSGREPPAAPQ